MVVEPVFRLLGWKAIAAPRSPAEKKIYIIKVEDSAGAEVDPGIAQGLVETLVSAVAADSESEEPVADGRLNVYEFMKDEVLRERVKPALERLGWTFHCIGGNDPKMVKILNVRDSAGVSISSTVVNDLFLHSDILDLISDGPEQPPDMKLEPEPEGEQTGAPLAEDGEPSSFIPTGPFELDYESLTETDRVRLRLYAREKIIVKTEDMEKLVAVPFKSSGWIYTGDHYGDRTFAFSLVSDMSGRIISPDTVKRTLREMGVPHEIEGESEDDGAADPHSEIVAEDLEGPEFPPPLQPLKWSETTLQLRPEDTITLYHSLTEAGQVAIGISLGSSQLIHLRCTRDQATSFFAQAASQGLERAYESLEQRKDTEQEDQNGT